MKTARFCGGRRRFGVIRFRIRCASGACQTDGKSVPTEPGSASTIRIRQLSTGGLDAIAFYPAD